MWQKKVQAMKWECVMVRAPVRWRAGEGRLREKGAPEA